MRLRFQTLIGAVVALMLGFCLHSRTSAAVQAPLSAVSALGKKIFFDLSLSASGRRSCATCHSPEHAYGPPNSLAVQLGGPEMDRQGARSVPSLRYVLNRTPFWNKRFMENPAERLLEGDDPPTGGFGWDGRFNTLRQQAAFPLLSSNEMALGGPEELAAKLQRASYAGDFRASGPGRRTSADRAGAF